MATVRTRLIPDDGSEDSSKKNYRTFFGLRLFSSRPAPTKLKDKDELHDFANLNQTSPAAAPPSVSARVPAQITVSSSSVLSNSGSSKSSSPRVNTASEVDDDFCPRKRF